MACKGLNTAPLENKGLQFLWSLHSQPGTDEASLRQTKLSQTLRFLLEGISEITLAKFSPFRPKKMRLGVGRGFTQNHPTGEEQSLSFEGLLLTWLPAGGGALGKPRNGWVWGSSIGTQEMFWASGEGGQGVRSWDWEDHCVHSDNASRGSTLPLPHWPLRARLEGERGRNYPLRVQTRKRGP